MSGIFRLPTELLGVIITLTLPDDFENLVVANKKFYSLCQPFIPRHTARRRQFTHFEFNMELQSLFDLMIRTSWDLICCIAAEPALPYYIIHADLAGDTSFLRCNAHGSFVDVYACSEAIGLIRSSPFVREADIDPDWLVAKIVKNLSEHCLWQRYSQAAAAFVISLLPRRFPAQAHFIGAVVKSTHNPVFGNQMPLAKITKVALARDWWGSSASEYRPFRTKLAPFLPLPRLRQLHIEDCVDNSPCDDEIAESDKLEVLHFEKCLLRADRLSNMLDHTPRLKVFRYSHSNKQLQWRTWEVMLIFNLIGRKCGSHLEGLSITTEHLEGHIPYETLDMSRFQCLLKLEIDLIDVHHMRRSQPKRVSSNASEEAKLAAAAARSSTKAPL